MRAPRTVRRVSTDVVVVIEEGKSTATSWQINKRNGLLNKNNWISCSRKSLPRPLNPDLSTSSPMDEPSPPCSSTDHPWWDENVNGAGNGWNHLSKDDGARTLGEGWRDGLGLFVPLFLFCSAVLDFPPIIRPGKSFLRPTWHRKGGRPPLPHPAPQQSLALYSPGVDAVRWGR